MGWNLPVGLLGCGVVLIMELSVSDIIRSFARRVGIVWDNHRNLSIRFHELIETCLRQLCGFDNISRC